MSPLFYLTPDTSDARMHCPMVDNKPAHHALVALIFMAIVTIVICEQ